MSDHSAPRAFFSKFDGGRQAHIAAIRATAGGPGIHLHPENSKAPVVKVPEADKDAVGLIMALGRTTLPPDIHRFFDAAKLPAHTPEAA